MKARQLMWTVLFFLLAATPMQIPAQQRELDRKRFEETKAKAEKGETAAQNDLGNCYRYGAGVAKDPAEAFKWFRKAAEQGHAEAQLNLGYCYQEGEGVPKDAAHAVKWYRKAAEQDYAQAQYKLGICYNKGDGVSKDASKAVIWWRKASEQGHAGAQVSLAACYRRGEGVDKNATEEEKWLRKAAEQGDLSGAGQYNLAFFLMQHKENPDLVELYKWLSLAVDQHVHSAESLLPGVARAMTREQIAEAQRLAREFKPSRALPPGAAPSNQP